MPCKHHVVTLSAAERSDLLHLIRARVALARTLTHARILLHADTSVCGPRWTDIQIAQAAVVSARTGALVRAS